MTKWSRFPFIVLVAMTYNIIDYNWFITEQLNFTIRELVTICLFFIQSLGIPI